MPDDLESLALETEAAQADYDFEDTVDGWTSLPYVGALAAAIEESWAGEDDFEVVGDAELGDTLE